LNKALISFFFIFFYDIINILEGDRLKKGNGFSLISTIIIIIVTAIVSGITTGVIVYNGYRQSTGLSYNELTSDSKLQEFLEVYSSILEDYYEDIDKEAMLDEAIAAMMNYLGDSYTTYLTKEETKALAEKLAGEYKGIGISIQENVIIDVTKDSPAMKAGLSVNDKIIKINDEDVSSYTSSKIASMIKNSEKDSIKITVLRNEEEISMNVDISTLYIPAISSEIIEENNKKIGYIYIGTFSNTLSKQIEQQMLEFKNEGITGLILDVRDNSGGYLTAASDVASIFLEKGKTIYSLQTKEEVETILDETSSSYDYPMMVLTNKNSASASEILAASLRDSYGATLLGETSYGKGKVQQTKSLKDGSMVKYTSAKWLTPNGICIDEVGLEPSIKVDNEYIYQDESQELIIDIIDKQLPEAIRLMAE